MTSKLTDKLIRLQEDTVDMLVEKVKNREISHQELRIAVDLLKNNSITVSKTFNKALSDLDEGLMKDFALDADELGYDG